MFSKLFSLILPGATWRDRGSATVGAFLGIFLTGAISYQFVASVPGLSLLIAPMGASAVLLFAVPSSPLAQPWPVLGGNVISSLVGMGCAQMIADPALAAGSAVGLAILVMSLLRCLHPPGGATALLAVVGEPAIADAGLSFAVLPVALNSLLMIAAAWVFHKFSRHSFPHRGNHVPADEMPLAMTDGFREEDFQAGLADMHEAFDIDTDDLKELLRRIESHAAARRELPEGALRKG
jgi:CBS domain-containing membrane protein